MLRITDILLAPLSPTNPLSVGLALGGQEPAPAGRPLVFWGDLVADVLDAPEAARLVDLIKPVLAQQPATSFRALAERVRWAITTPDAAPSTHLVLIAALEEALLAAVAYAQGLTPAALLAVEYGFIPGDRSPSLPLLLEISDYDATAERIDRMLALRPAGIGYRLTAGERVAEAIGENGEHLQRFVRELRQRADASGSPFSIYLGLNGALGRLAGDPLRHIGKVLAHCVGLQNAAGTHQLILEEPFLLDDPLAQLANLHRLNDFLRLTPDSLKRSRPTLLVARAQPLPAELQMYADIAAAHALTFDPYTSSMESVLVGIKRCRAANIGSFLTLRATELPRRPMTIIDMAWAAGAAGLIATYDGHNDGLLSLAARRLAELSTPFNLLDVETG